MKIPLILISLILPMSEIFSKPPPTKKPSSEVLSEVSKNYFRVLDYENNFYRINLNTSERANLLRAVSKTEINFDEFVFNLDINNKLKHTLSYVGNAMSLGYFDAGIKARATQYELTLKSRGWAYNEFYGNFNIGLQILSIGEYAIYNSKNFWDFSRHLIASTLIYSVYEHLGYWTYVNSSIPTEKYGELVGWRGKHFYLHNPSGNDVPWMEKTIPGYISRLRGNPELWVGSEDVLIWSFIAPVLAYVIAPNSELEKPNRITKFKPFIYADGYDQNGITGLNNGIKMGLSYDAIKFKQTKLILSGYSNYDLNARAKIGFERKSLYCDFIVGANTEGEILCYGLSSCYKKDRFCISASYEKDSTFPLTVGLAGIF